MGKRFHQLRTKALLWMLLALLWSGAMGTSAFAQFMADTSARVTLRSRLEGQFLVKGVPFPPSIAPTRQGVLQSLDPNTSADWPKSVRLDPATAIVVCERIKQIFLQELGMTDQWRGLIEVEIDFYPRGLQRPITLSHRLMNDGLHTQLKVADEVTPHRFVQALTQVLLLEMANRNITQKQMTDVPLWMLEGMTQLIMQRSGPALFPTQGAPKTFSIIAANPVKDAKARLRTLIEPPTFDFLANPGPEAMRGINWLVFQDASLVLTCELLNQPDGRSHYYRTLIGFKNYLNWQLAFLKAWENQFETMTDVEKWWALIMVTSQKESGLHGWSLTQSLEKLDQILSEASVTTIYQLHQPKRPSTVHLQQIAENWTPNVQTYFFERVAAQLKAFELVAEPRVSDLAKRYRTTILDYIRQPRLYVFFGKDAPSRADLKLLRKRFNYLDREREGLWGVAEKAPPPKPLY
ncbi:MAG: hypothetical protein ACOX2U_02515 [Limisphaerales bacterium]|mgnify:CR=1 FL=1|jgi:hypothetical protein|nr:hypothetical protein [Verrucomicrobiota bacterium]